MIAATSALMLALALFETLSTTVPLLSRSGVIFISSVISPSGLRSVRQLPCEWCYRFSLQRSASCGDRDICTAGLLRAPLCAVVRCSSGIVVIATAHCELT